MKLVEVQQLHQQVLLLQLLQQLVLRQLLRLGLQLLQQLQRLLLLQGQLLQQGFQLLLEQLVQLRNWCVWHLVCVIFVVTMLCKSHDALYDKQSNDSGLHILLLRILCFHIIDQDDLGIQRLGIVLCAWLYIETAIL